MRTENYKHGVVSLILVFALVFSVVTIAAPLASAGDWNNSIGLGGTRFLDPSIYQVIAGENFLIRHQLEYNAGTDGVDSDGSYTVTMSWANYGNKENENFTFLMAEAYFTSGPHSGEKEQADVTLASSPSGSDTNWALSVSRPADNKTSWNGQFNVDIWLGAWGYGGVPHSGDASEHGDNHPIPPSGNQLGGVIVIEPGLDSWNRAPITVDVIGASCTVDITPSAQSGWTNDVLTYTVTVNNTGEVDDNYTLNLGDTGGWTLGIVPGLLQIPASGSDTATLSVTVGSGTDTITVTADGVYSSNSDTCTATQLTGPKVDVEVEPDYQDELPCTTLDYTVTITNIGTVPDNYTVTVSDDAGWGPGFGVPDLFFSEYIEGTDYNKALEIFNYTCSPVDLSDYQIELYSNGSATITSSQVLAGTLNSGDVYVVINGSAVSATLQAEADLTSSTINHNGDDGYVLRRISDNAVVDSIGQYSVDPGSEWPGGGVDDTLVRKDTIYQGDTNFNDAFTFATEWDSYSTDNTDFIGWHQYQAGSYNSIIVSLDPEENQEISLKVHIPLDAVACTVDNITVTATSQENVLVDDSETVQAHAKAALSVSVTAEPEWQEDYISSPAVNFWATITNLGTATDNYEVVLTDTLSWDPTWDVTTEIVSTDDVAVVEAFPDSNQWGTSSYNMYNGWDPTYLSERDYLKFDISELNGSLIKSATLWLCSKYGPSYPGYNDTWHLVDAMSVDDDSWDEGTLTWNNAPPVGSVLDTENFQGDLFIGQYHWYSWDVTDFVADEMLVNQLVSIGLKAQVEDNTIHPNGGSGGWFYTKDAGYNEPYLEITYAPGVDNTVQITLDEGESVTLGFNVKIPGDATTSQTDDITVTATSQTDPMVGDSVTVQAHVSEPTLRAVGAWIEGESWQETHKDPLTYVIRIRNAGLIADMYKLIAHDLYGWPLYVEPQEIYLKPDHEAQAALSVTIPYQTPGSTTDTITVDIVGKLASGTFTDPENHRTSVVVQAHSKEVWGVDLNVYPSIHQTGHPGSPLTWLVTVTNTGNVPDTFSLDLDDQWVRDLVDEYPDWAGGFQPGDLTHMDIPLQAYEEASILLTLTVPDTEDMRTGVHNDITISATSLGSYLEDSQVVVAQVRQQMPHVPQGEIKLQAVAGYVAIDIWPTYYDFGVLNEMDIENTPPDYFTVRNVGNVYVDVTIVGMDATSKPGEPAAKWTLGDGAIGIDTYALWWTSGGEIVNTVTKEEKILTPFLEPGNETTFDLMIQAPSTFTTPAKMWTKVAITARKLHPQPEQP